MTIKDLKIGILEQENTSTENIGPRFNTDKQNMPGRQFPGLAGPNTYNWLGSSYSGVDVKVIAHIYKPASYNEQVKSFEAQKATDDTLVEVFTNFLNGGLEAFDLSLDLIKQGIFISTDTSGTTDNYRDLKKIWLGQAGVDVIENGGEVSSQVLGFFTQRMHSTGSTSNISVKMSRARQEHKRSSESIAARLKDVKELAENSIQTLVLATLQTLSVQTHREKFAVRALGKSYVDGYTRGPRTIAGSMIFTTFNEHALSSLIRGMEKSGYYGESLLDTNLKTLIPDQLPPIDITIVFANEYGHFSRMGIYGLEFMNDGMTFSVEDLMTEGVMNFVARDIDIMTAMGKVRLSRIGRGLYDSPDDKIPLTGSQLLVSGKEQYDTYLKELGIRRSFRGR